MVNGYSGFAPDSYKRLRSDISKFPADEGVEALRRRGVTHVTVNCGLGYPGCYDLMSAMSHARRLRLTMNTVWMGQPVQLYEVLAPELVEAHDFHSTAVSVDGVRHATDKRRAAVPAPW